MNKYIVFLFGFVLYLTVFPLKSFAGDRFVPVSLKRYFNNSGSFYQGYSFPKEKFTPEMVVAGIPFKIETVSGKNNRLGEFGFRAWDNTGIVGMVRIPKGNYIYAYFLCCGDTDPEKENKIYVNSGQYDLSWFHSLKVPAYNDKEGNRDTIGYLEFPYMYKDGKKVKESGRLWVQRVPLCGDNFLQIPRWGEMPGLKSGVHTFAITLERAPLQLKVYPHKEKKTHPYPAKYNFEMVGDEFNVFVAKEGEKPNFKIKIVNQEAKKYKATLYYKIEDVNGKIIEKKLYISINPNSSRELFIFPPVKKFGCYFIRYKLVSNNIVMATHYDTFAYIPHRLKPNKRFVGFRSRYIGTIGNSSIRGKNPRSLYKGSRSAPDELEFGRLEGVSTGTIENGRDKKGGYIIEKRILPGEERTWTAFGGHNLLILRQAFETCLSDYFDIFFYESCCLPCPPEDPNGLWAFGVCEKLPEIFYKYGYKKPHTCVQMIPSPIGEPAQGITWADWWGNTEVCNGKYWPRALLYGMKNGIERFTFGDYPFIPNRGWSPGWKTRRASAWGFIRSHRPSPGYIAVGVIIDKLGNSEYYGEIPAGMGKYVLAFKDRLTKEIKLACWTVNSIPEQITLNSKAKKLSLTDMSWNSKTLYPKNGKLILTLSNSPVILEGIDKLLLSQVIKQKPYPEYHPVKKNIEEKGIYLSIGSKHKKDETIGRVVRRITAGELQKLYYVTVNNLNEKSYDLQLEIIPPEGWEVYPRKKSISLGAAKGKKIAQVTQDFSLQVPFDAKPGGYKIKAELKNRGRVIDRVYLYDILLESPIKINYLVKSFSPGNKIEVSVVNPKDKPADYQLSLSCPDLTFKKPVINLKMRGKETITTSFIIASRKPVKYNRYRVTAELKDKSTGKIATLSKPLSCRLIVRAEKPVKIDGCMDDWEDAYPVNLTYPMPIAGRQWKKVDSNYCPDVGKGKKTGYAGIMSRYYGGYTGYGGSIYFKYDDKYFYGFLDIKDSSVFGMEQGRIDPVCGLVDYGDSQIIMFDIDNNGVITSDEYAFMLFPFGPIHSYIGEESDPYPVIIPVTIWLKELTTPLPENFDLNSIEIASKMVKDKSGKETGYRIEFSIPLEKIGLTPERISSGISLQLQSTDVTDDGVLQSWLWNNPTKENFLGTMKYRFLETVPAYTCYKTKDEIKIDGNLSEKSWRKAKSVWLVDYKTAKKPYNKTNVKMLYDDKYLYIAFKCYDIDIWATMKNKDDDLWKEEVVEVFIDDDGDGKNYLEIEVNPLNTIWDGKISDPKTYKVKKAKKYNSGVITAVKVKGTINNRKDKDEYWIVEMAIPFNNFTKVKNIRQKENVWRVNFCRCDGKVSLKNREYTAWSPTYGIFQNPERFGKVVFK